MHGVNRGFLQPNLMVLQTFDATGLIVNVVGEPCTSGLLYLFGDAIADCPVGDLSGFINSHTNNLIHAFGF